MPSVASCEKRLVDEAVVEKRLVELAMVANIVVEVACARVVSPVTLSVPATERFPALSNVLVAVPPKYAF